MVKKKEVFVLVFMAFLIQWVLSTLTLFPERFHQLLYLSLSLLLILYIFLVRYIIEIFHIQKPLFILAISTILLNILALIDFLLYPLFGGSTGQMYGVVFIYGFYPISTILGILYGIYLYKHLP
jgi:hypothetical protein